MQKPPKYTMPQRVEQVAFRGLWGRPWLEGLRQATPLRPGKDSSRGPAGKLCQALYQRAMGSGAAGNLTLSMERSIIFDEELLPS
jgi:hypothetical protein